MTAAVTVLLDELPEGVAEVRRQLESQAADEGRSLGAVSWRWRAEPLDPGDSTWITVTGEA